MPKPKTTDNRCPCGREFRTPQGLGLHFKSCDTISMRVDRVTRGWVLRDRAGARRALSDWAQAQSTAAFEQAQRKKA